MYLLINKIKFMMNKPHCFFGFLLDNFMSKRKDWGRFNANVYTVNDSFGKATAFAIKNGKFISVGGDEILNLYRMRLNLMLRVYQFTQGFIDAHCHFFSLGLSLGEVDLRGCKSIEEIEKVIDIFTKNRTNVIIGRGWDQNLWKIKFFQIMSFK